MIDAALQNLRLPKVSELRISAVTICVAALCKGGKVIVTASDQMVGLSEGLAADHLALKMKAIHSNWSVLSASNDAEHVDFILENAASLLSKHKSPSPQQVVNAIGRACDAKMGDEVRLKALSKYQITPRELWLEGRKKLPEKVFERLALKIDSVPRLDCDFLACGFDEFGDGHICRIGTNSTATIHDSQGFWAIGTGVHSALDLLSFYADRYTLTKHTAMVSDCIYQVCAAKFMAEQTHEAIGHQTTVAIHQFGQPTHWLSPAGISMARKKWEREGMPKIPKNLLDLAEFVCTSEELSTPSERAKKLLGRRKPIIKGYELG